MKLMPIELANGTKTDHPDIKIGKQYLVQWGENFAAGRFQRAWFGLVFHPFWGQSFQYDKPGHNKSDWRGVWEIRSLPASLVAAEPQEAGEALRKEAET